MTLDAAAAYQAIVARDARFDGRLFVGVTSTGVYCRPICRVRTPMRQNCRFFDSAARAEAASFRPCMKCRPEIAPGSALPWTVMDASATLARQAATALDEPGDEPLSVAALAERLGVSERHLRRIFAAEHGVTPSQYVQTRRLLLAKHLLTDTRLPVAQVALSSGFRSLRRFNAAFVGSYRMNPSRLRRATTAETTAAEAGDGSVTVNLGYRAPYDHAALLRFIDDRAIDGIERVAGLGVRRSVRAGVVGEADGWIEATFRPEAAQVRVRFAAALVPASGRLVAAVRRWLDLDAAPDAIDASLHDLPGAPGLRLPGSLDAFELTVRAVLGQQVTVAAARTLACRMAERFGAQAATPWPDIDRTFPAPQCLGAAAVADIAGLGIVRSRAEAIAAIARDWPALTTVLQRRSDPERAIERLCELPGIGPWTAHYIAMRVLGWPDAFPPGDVAVLKAMAQRFGAASAKAALAQARSWQPWRSYAVLRLWDSLRKPT
ncbi:MAG: Ada metal-binding domain-containing protein [Rhizobacter sp.]